MSTNFDDPFEEDLVFSFSSDFGSGSVLVSIGFYWAGSGCVAL